MNVALTDNVRVGQIWADLDKRSTGRQVEVLEVVRDCNGLPLIDPYAVVRTNAGRQTRIRLDRFRESTTGYRLVRDPTAETGSEGPQGLSDRETRADGCPSGTDALRPSYEPMRRGRRTPLPASERTP